MEKKLSGLAVAVAVLFGIAGVAHAQNSMPVIAEFQGEHHNSKYGYSMVSLDFNHDGYDDLAVGSMSYAYVAGSVAARGKVYIYFGGPGFSSDTPASLTLEGDCTSYDSGRRIWAIYKIGDVSGDGYDDLCVRVEDYGESMKLLIFYGGTHGLNTPAHVIVLEGYTAVYPLGDYNGDGLGEMGFNYASTGMIQSIIWGGSYAEQIVSQGEADISYVQSINGIGDINSDGYADFTTGFAYTYGSSPYNLIRLYYGNPEGSISDFEIFFQAPVACNDMSKPLGDMNADGYDDFMGYVTTNGMFAWLGGENINNAVPSFNLSPAWFGSPSSRALEFGDFNHDGYSDAVGAEVGYREAVIWLGKQNVNGTADLYLLQHGYENFGYSVVTGDFNADSYDDIAIAASHQNSPHPNGNFPGYVWVYGGNAQLEDTTVANDDPGVPPAGAGLQVRLSPNPLTTAEGKLTVKIGNTGLASPRQGEIGLYNLKGQRMVSRLIIQDSVSSEHILELPKLPSGVYLCRVRVGQASATARFCVVK
jgi:hypothetical protein